MSKSRIHQFLRPVWRRAREPLVAGAFACVDILLPRLPRRVLMAAARTLGTVGMWFDRRGRRIARANLRVLYGVRLTPLRSRRLVLGSYRRAAAIALDSIWFSRDTRARVAAWTSVDEILRSEVMNARPALVVAAHFGNWEMTLLASGFVGLPLVAVVKEQWSQTVTDRANRLRSSLGVRLVYKDGALRALIHELRAGHVAGFVLDQYTNPAGGGVWVDFGGLPASISNGVALLSRRFQAPVFLGFPYARKNGRYDMRVSAAMRPAPDESDAVFTQRIAHGLLYHIRRHPSQWMLMYPRWERIPTGASAADFPFYSRPLKRTLHHENAHV